MSSNDFNEIKKAMDSAVPKGKLHLIKKRAARGSSQSSGAGPDDHKRGEEMVVRKSSPQAHLQHQHHPQQPHHRQQQQQQLYPLPPHAVDRGQRMSRPPAVPTHSGGTKARTSGDVEKASNLTTFSDSGSYTQLRPDIDINSDSPPVKGNPTDSTIMEAASSHSTKQACVDQGPVKRVNGTSGVASASTASSSSAPALRCSVQWLCQECSPPHACIPVRSESRCLCGHRYKEHKMQPPRPGEEVRPENVKYKCGCKGCACKHFFFIVAEGAWILRCRCKHKHIEHDCGSQPFKCKKPRCSCNGFDSPWVCNCGHPWSSHQQQMVQAAQPTGLIAEALEMHRREALAGGGSEKAATGGADLTDMVGLLTDGSAMRDLDMNVRRDGHS